MTLLINNNADTKASTFRILLLAFLLWTPHYSIAAPLGLPDNTAKIGYGAAYAYLQVDDPDGDTNPEWKVQPVNLIYSDWLFGDIKQWTEVYYFDTSLDAGSNDIGQNISSFGVRFSMQKSFRLTKSWSPWFGGGVSISSTKYSARHTRDSEGFLLQRFDDRDEFGVSVLLNFVSEWVLDQEWSLAAKLEQSIPLSDDITQFSAMAVLLYRY
ncbi:hypothetical protein [Kaarinaea lacus]